MTHLIRCRAAASEIATLFDAKPDPALDWLPTIWPGEKAIVVTSGARGRHLHALPWGLPRDPISRTRGDRPRTTLFAREITGNSRAPLGLDLLERCLIAVEDVAYPIGEKGHRTRSWLGLWDVPICAWAGLCSPDPATGGFAGMLTVANACADPVSQTMPILLPPSQWDAWLAGASLLALEQAYDNDAFYLERTPEVWASGDVPED
ncbi:protein of unknown function DUF159 [Sphingobium indicum BiD32]|jgi:putative SOS response-associated peptidase YedK|uniref:SOS response-associated peptidase YedK n=2 Tax=Sphingobium TaxID=165695 RepID=A0A401J4K0_SPHXE|nr:MULTISPECIES: hypothetical protein [Sphingomonadales]MBA4757538.1 hypothetical protein [Sphingosinicella sp.]GBH31576.1 hypothetical protein MBESOW_P2833 [Sphingobium xenophagum]CCW19398.1 protein of unknown function DUF159 [Sphingobium indicum BiD32]